MKITIDKIAPDIEEEIIIRCHEVSGEILNFVKGMAGNENSIAGIKGEEICRISPEDVFYFEVVDSKSFIYCRDAVYESKLKLYEFEERYRNASFFRASKSMVLNADKIESIKPSISGRFEARLLNGEKVIVSRQYVAMLKKKIGL